ncbi:MAG: hypothetical protein VB039_10325 [Oscillospiraceae bacterium]|nr:hypothetical protein [Oscillospiraceae bacterium]
MNYKKMYFFLFNGITDALAELEKNNKAMAVQILLEHQRASEEMYISERDTRGAPAVIRDGAASHPSCPAAGDVVL